MTELKSKEQRLALADDLLARAEAIEMDIRRLSSSFPIELHNLRGYTEKTVDYDRVVVSRLHHIYNGLRRYDYDEE